MTPLTAAPLLCLAALAAPALAQPPVSYGFDGTLDDHFDLFINEPGILSGQADERLLFSTGGTTFTDDDYHVEAYTSSEFTPRYNESWSASIDVHLPLELDTDFVPMTSIDQAIEIGIAVLYTDGAEVFNNLTASLDVFQGEFAGDPVVRRYSASAEIGGESVGEDETPANGVENATLTITFNAQTKQLVAFNQDGDAFQINIGPGPTAWGMKSTDTFLVALYTSISHRAIRTDNPVTFDNFVGGPPVNLCPADTNGDGILDQGDIQTFVTLFLAGDLAADMNGDSVLDQGDIQTFVTAFLTGC